MMVVLVQEGDVGSRAVLFLIAAGGIFDFFLDVGRAVVIPQQTGLHVLAS
jgi:hypothetical protein